MFCARVWVHLLVIRPLLRLLFGLGLHGREQLRDLDQFVLTANHNSHLDTFLLFSALPVRSLAATRVVAARDYFARHRRVFALVDRLLCPVWVDRISGGSDALEEMKAHLESGGNLIMFPEGSRGEAGEMGRFRKGIGRLVEVRRDMPVLPVFILGPERALPRRSSVPLPLWNHVFIGPPLRLAGSPAQMTEALQAAVIALGESETAGRHRRGHQRPRAFTVALLGIDGSGKSTLSARLAGDMSAGQSCCLVSDSLQMFADGEPSPIQPLLKEKVRGWISRQAKQARDLARYKVPKLVELLLRDRLLGEARRWYGPRLVFLDGSPLMNMTAWSVLYRDEHFDSAFCGRAMNILSGREIPPKSDPLLEQYSELAAMMKLGLTRLEVPDAVIFIDLDPASAMRRIMSRGQDVQPHENEEKLSRLREAYLLVIEAAARDLSLPTLVLDGELDPDTLAAQASAFVAESREVRDGR